MGKNLPTDNSLSLDQIMSLKCQECNRPMKRVSWKITAGAADAEKK